MTEDKSIQEPVRSEKLEKHARHQTRAVLKGVNAPFPADIPDSFRTAIGAGSKLDKAQALDVEVIDEQEFLARRADWAHG